MMKIIARLNAFETGYAVPAATHLQLNIQPHALIVCPLAMAGEDTTIHALAVGGVGAAPLVRVVPDPRMRDDQYALIGWFGGILRAYYDRCRAAGDFPQVWVSSGAAAGQLDILADRLRFVREDDEMKKIGELLTYVTERHPVAGQQALITATGALGAHYATGQQDADDEHLGVFLTWLRPPPGMDIRLAIENAEREVMGVKTDPIFDRNHLAPLLTAYNESTAGGDRATEMRYRADAITAAMTPIVIKIYQGVQAAIGYLNGRFPPAGVLPFLAERERDEFKFFMSGRDAGVALPYRDKPRAGVRKISEREDAAQNFEAQAVYDDRMAQARARLTGRILSGVAENVTMTKVGRKKLHRFDVVSQQSHLHLRAGDMLAWLGDVNLRCVVELVARHGATTSVSLLIKKGMQAVGPPTAGALVEFAPPPPDWEQLGRWRVRMKARLETMPWTSGEAAPVVQPLSTAIKPVDLLGAVEALR